MYKTIWLIHDEDKNGKVIKSEFTQYHFGKTPQFPAWYMEENHAYEIEMLWNFRLILRPNLFIKCLFKSYAVKG